ncbi:MAG: hypothetical protein IKF07_08945 [Eubacterium sp.]|nr:hypothetical protein [Eubacterium sp.]
METVRIGVRIKDRDYRNALLRGLSHESRDFQFAVIDGGDNGITEDECQIVLTDEQEPHHVPVITLTYHEMYDLGYRKDRMEIFRYEDARVFVNKIIYYYAEMNGIDLYFHGKRKCRKIVFSSMRGGCGTTAAAMTAARFLKFRFDRKSLFISLCPIDGSREYTGACDGGNMLSLLYHLSTGDDVPLCKFISSQDGVDHIRGQRDNRAASEMTIKEMKQLIKLIDSMGQYDFIFIDVGSHLSSLARFLMDGADVRVVMRQRGDSTDERGFDDGSSGAVRVINVMAFDDGSAAASTDEVALSYDPGSFVAGDKRTYIDIRGRYGKDIGVLAEKIMGCAD